MRRVLIVLLPLVVVAGLIVWLRGGGGTIRDDSVAVPAGPGARQGHCIKPQGVFSLRATGNPIGVESELGTCGPDGVFTPVPLRVRLPADVSADAGGVLRWSGPPFTRLPPGTYVVRTTLLDGAGTRTPRELATCTSQPLTLP